MIRLDVSGIWLERLFRVLGMTSLHKSNFTDKKTKEKPNFLKQL